MFSECLAGLNKAEGLLGHDFSMIHLVRGEALYDIKSYGQAASEFQKYLNKEKDGPAATEVKKALEQALAASETARNSSH
jgi:hypothetical protein